MIGYIELFKQKPYALINGKPIVQLPSAFGLFFARAYRQGKLKACIEVLKLLKTHSQKQVAAAIELSMAYDTYSSEGVKNILDQLHSDRPKIEKLTHFKRSELADVRIPSVDLNRYNTLLTQENGRV